MHGHKLAHLPVTRAQIAGGDHHKAWIFHAARLVKGRHEQLRVGVKADLPAEEIQRIGGGLRAELGSAFRCRHAMHRRAPFFGLHRGRFALRDERKRKIPHPRRGDVVGVLVVVFRLLHQAARVGQHMRFGECHRHAVIRRLAVKRIPFRRVRVGAPGAVFVNRSNRQEIAEHQPGLVHAETAARLRHGNGEAEVKLRAFARCDLKWQRHGEDAPVFAAQRVIGPLAVYRHGAGYKAARRHIVRMQAQRDRVKYVGRGVHILKAQLAVYFGRTRVDGNRRLIQAFRARLLHALQRLGRPVRLRRGFRRLRE